MPNQVIIVPANTLTFVSSALSLGLPAGVTDIFQLAGATGKKIVIPRIVISGIATAAVDAPLTVVKRTALSTGGTPAPVVPTLMDPGYGFQMSPGNAAVYPSSAAASTVFGGAATPGAASGPSGGAVYAAYLPIVAPAAPSSLPTVIDFADLNLQPPVLRLPTEALCINFGGATYAGGAVSFAVYYTEEGSS